MLPLANEAGAPLAGGASGDLSRATLSGQELILTPYGKERWDRVDHAKDPNTACLPPGPARMIMMAHPAMIVQRPDVVAILTESQRTFRLIYTDGRGHPHDIADYPEWMGSSIGRWEGDTLVVDTVGINERTWLDTAGHEHSEKLRLTERFRLADANALEHGTKSPEGTMDLVVGPQVTGIASHESSGHPTEADRVLGREAAQAGKSFITPASIGQRVGSSVVNVVDDPTVPHAVAYYAYDDEGVKARRRYLYKGGVITELLQNRETAMKMLRAKLLERRDPRGRVDRIVAPHCEHGVERVIAVPLFLEQETQPPADFQEHFVGDSAPHGSVSLVIPVGQFVKRT